MNTISKFEYYALSELKDKLENFEKKDLIQEDLFDTGYFYDYETSYEDLAQKFYECAFEDSESFYDCFKEVKENELVSVVDFNSYEKDALMRAMLLTKEEKFLCDFETVEQAYEAIEKELKKDAYYSQTIEEAYGKETDFDYYVAKNLKKAIEITDYGVVASKDPEEKMHIVLDEWNPIIYNPSEKLNMFAFYGKDSFIESYDEAVEYYTDIKEEKINYNDCKIMNNILYCAARNFATENDFDTEKAREECQKVIENYFEKELGKEIFVENDKGEKMINPNSVEVISKNFSLVTDYFDGKNEVMKIAAKDKDEANKFLSELSKVTENNLEILDVYFQLPEDTRAIKFKPGLYADVKIQDGVVKLKEKISIEEMPNKLKDTIKKLSELESGYAKYLNWLECKNDNIEFILDQNENTLMIYDKFERVEKEMSEGKEFSFTNKKIKDLALKNNLDIEYKLIKDEKITEVTAKIKDGEVEIIGEINPTKLKTENKHKTNKKSKER